MQRYSSWSVSVLAKSTSSDKQVSSRNKTHRRFFITEPTDDLAVWGQTTVTSDEDLSPSVEEASVPLSNLVHRGGREGEVDLVSVEVLHTEGESLSPGVTGDNLSQPRRKGRLRKFGGQTGGKLSGNAGER